MSDRINPISDYNEVTEGAIKNWVEEVLEEVIFQECSVGENNKAEICNYSGSLDQMIRNSVSMWLDAFRKINIAQETSYVKKSTSIECKGPCPRYLNYAWHNETAYPTTSQANSIIELYAQAHPRYDPSVRTGGVSIEFSHPLFYISSSDGSFNLRKYKTKPKRTESNFDYYSVIRGQQDAKALQRLDVSHAYYERILAVLKSLYGLYDGELPHPEALLQIKSMEAALDESLMAIMSIAQEAKNSLLFKLSELHGNFERHNGGKISFETPAMIMGFYPRLRDMDSFVSYSRVQNTLHQVEEEPYLVARDLNEVELEVGIETEDIGNFITEIGQFYEIELTANSENIVCEVCTLHLSSASERQSVEIKSSDIFGKRVSFKGFIDSILPGSDRHKLRIITVPEFGSLSSLNSSLPQTWSEKQTSTIVQALLAPGGSLEIKLHRLE